MESFLPTTQGQRQHTCLSVLSEGKHATRSGWSAAGRTCRWKPLAIDFHLLGPLVARILWFILRRSLLCIRIADFALGLGTAGRHILVSAIN